MRIAVLDDEESQLELIRCAMATLGHECHAFTHGKELLRRLRRDSFDLLILDWQVPDLSGIEVVRWARQKLETRIPVLMVTQRSEERDLVEGLNAGADDYMVKPMRIGEFIARVKALLRRSYPVQHAREQAWGDYCFDIASRELTVAGEPVRLKKKEFDLALFLFRNHGRLLSRAHLQEAVWGMEMELPSRSLDTHVSTLRNKLHLRPENGWRLNAVYSLGYRLEAVAVPIPARAAIGTATRPPVLAQPHLVE